MIREAARDKMARIIHSAARVALIFNSIEPFLMNLAEVASGLAMLAAMPANTRSILTGLSIEYVKKARGTLVAESTVDLPPIAESREVHVQAIIRDRANDDVARATVRWRVGPIPT